ncbi:MAG: MBL fold metallo-hydrolase [Halieaceae bacterium]|nr:MBL fold metallo-hydrolase [Halieaceae bacterium]
MKSIAKSLMGACVFAAVSLNVVAGASSDTKRPGAGDLFQYTRAVVQEYPHIVQSMSSSKHDGFGGPSSRAIAHHMASRTSEAAIADARKMVDIQQIDDRTWFIVMPWVNLTVMETDEGLLLLDTGYAPAGPVLVDVLKELSDKPVNTIVFTHHHLDHAYGAWALQQAGMAPRVIASDAFLSQMGLDVQLADFANARMNNQDPRDIPRTMAEMVAPTETFTGTKTLVLGEETFVLHTARGETEDHVWIHAPDRGIVVSGDFHQPFLPNAGNGKRRQRHVDEWAQALRDMAATNADVLLPMHGPAIQGATLVQEKLDTVASAFESIVAQVTKGLNAGWSQDAIIHSVELPLELQNHADLDPYYNTVTDVAKMVVRQYTGWWDGVPSHWQAPRSATTAKAVINAAGGLEEFIAKTQALMGTDIAMASQFADWAYQAYPNNLQVLELGMAVYAKRIVPGMPLNEISVYLGHMAEIKWRMAGLEK